MNTLFELILFWLIMISFLSILVTVSDKVSAIQSQRRVPETTLLLLGLIGGAPIMFLTMLTIRHKTRHLKFMLSLPVFILLQGVLLFLSYLYLS